MLMPLSMMLTILISADEQANTFYKFNPLGKIANSSARASLAKVEHEQIEAGLATSQAQSSFQLLSMLITHSRVSALQAVELSNQASLIATRASLLNK